MKIVPGRLIAAIAAAFTASMALTGIVTTAAHASVTPYFCSIAEDNNTYCLNDWNGKGYHNPVKMYGSLASHESFEEEPIDRCGGQYVTLTCPFNKAEFNQRYLHFKIVQLRYVTNGLCVAQGSSEPAVLGNCNLPTTGFDGDAGTVFVDHNGFMISLYWTNKGIYGNDASCMFYQTGNAQASPVYLDLPTSDGCPKWFQSGVGN